MMLVFNIYDSLKLQNSNCGTNTCDCNNLFLSFKIVFFSINVTKIVIEKNLFIGWHLSIWFHSWWTHTQKKNITVCLLFLLLSLIVFVPFLSLFMMIHHEASNSWFLALMVSWLLFSNFFFSDEADEDDTPKPDFKPPPVIPKEDNKTGANKKTYFVCNERKKSKETQW